MTVKGMRGVNYLVIRETKDAYVLHNAELGKVQIGSRTVGVAVTTSNPRTVAIALEIANVSGVVDFAERITAMIEDLAF